MSTKSGAAARTPQKRSPSTIPLSMGMILVTLGVVYGDIGTSPMYTIKAIISGNGGLATIDDDVIIGALSLIIWTITLITTVKYVLIAMKADNKGEGGIFALYSLVRRCAKWLIIPAMIGGAALLADGILTPAVTVTTAIEGLRTIELGRQLIGDNQHIVVGITIIILCILFVIQRAGTSSIGKLFGPVMTIWFLFLGFTGLFNMGADLNVLRALNPLRAVTFLFSNKNAAGMMVLGNVFLCTTGAEALYSDMGHVGKANIYASWPFVKCCLILNYLGQGAWVLANRTDPTLLAMTDMNPFFEMLPEVWRPFAVILSAFAAIIASQALITGSYSIVSEAIRLNLLPHMKITYPSETKGQLYIPLVNNIMWVSCIFVVLLFQTSSHMEAAYGLAITLTMLMTTILLYTYLSQMCHRRVGTVVFLMFFGVLESTFFFSSLTKFMHGGYFTVLMATLIFLVMFIWRRGTAIERTQSVYLPVKDYIGQLAELRDDPAYNYTADNLVFLTNDSSPDKLDRDILYSILDKRPKRARAYWFLNVTVTDEPNTLEYSVNSFGTDFIFKVQLRLGFRVNQRVNAFLRQIVGNLVQNHELAKQDHHYSIYKNPGAVGDFRFCILHKALAPETALSGSDYHVMMMKYAIRHVCGSPARWYGLETSSIIYEYVPLFTRAKAAPTLKRIAPPDTTGTAPKMAKIDEDDEDIFSDSVADETSNMAAITEESVIGGDTAVFRPLSDEDIEEEEEAENAGNAASADKK
ncbi:MAG: KUP/HAK/KT family potassium transporter [Atopobiaceae bacterium]|nr:KUP/HAK/KT family potassium transporter [Atopobiaceae bacterium]MCI2050873.1 KUP/HAK/KT family potassium transporter [Atopobiaceae bacterium]